MQEWARIAQNAIERGIDWGRRKLDEIKLEIVKTCKENSELITTLTELAAKSGIRVAAEIAAKEAGRAFFKSATKNCMKNAIKVGLKTTVNPVAIGSDIAQGFLQYAGYKEVGRKVGLLGNIGSCAAFGLVAGGPIGAAFGIVAGGGTWIAGELVGAVVGAAVDNVVQDKKQN